MRYFTSILIITVSFLLGCSSSKTLTTASPEETKQAILDNQWIFTAQSATPQKGRNQMLTSRYDMRTSKDNITCYLPYFGQSFSGASAMTNPNPLDFKSTNFNIDREELKKGGWRVTLKPKDISAIQLMIFNFYENGTANLSVTLTDRTPISFSGTVEPLKP